MPEFTRYFQFFNTNVGTPVIVDYYAQFERLSKIVSATAWNRSLVAG